MTFAHHSPSFAHHSTYIAEDAIDGRTSLPSSLPSSIPSLPVDERLSLPTLNAIGEKSSIPSSVGDMPSALREKAKVPTVMSRFITAARSSSLGLLSRDGTGSSDESFSTIRTARTSLEAMHGSLVQKADVLRATTAGAALACAGGIFRGGGNQYGAHEDFYEQSFCVEMIQYFWSHSWRANTKKKVMTLMLFHNAAASIIVSVLSALVGCAIGWPNRMFKVPAVPDELSDKYDNYWPTKITAMLFGFVGFFMTLLCWKSKATVFLDKVCICQTDAKQKQAGIKSLGGFLRHSKQMLILWDETYLERLWCVFELATVSKLKVQMDPFAVVIRGVELGFFVLIMICLTTFTILANVLACPCMSMGGLLFNTFVETSYYVTLIISCLVAPSIYRPWCRKMSKVQEQIAAFTFSGSRCFCCDNDHLLPGTDVRIPCDREVVKECVEAWFGSVEAFDQYVRDSLGPQFTAQTILPYRYALLISAPRLWFLIAYTMADTSNSPGQWSPSKMFRLWAFNIIIYPCTLISVLRLGHLTISFPTQGWKGRSVNVLHSFCILLIFSAEYYLIYFFLAAFDGWGVYSGACFVVAVVTSVLFPDIRAYWRGILQVARDAASEEDDSNLPEMRCQEMRRVYGNVDAMIARAKLDSESFTFHRLDSEVPNLPTGQQPVDHEATLKWEDLETEDVDQMKRYETMPSHIVRILSL